MPLFWRCFSKNFFKIFLLCISSFLVILIILRAQHIAKFAASKEGAYFTVVFTLLQLPYILPFAIALSTLVSSFLVTKEFCTTGGLTCLRGFGLSIHQIFFPLYALGMLLGMLNFILISEICPFSKKKTKELLNSSLHRQPLALLDDEQFAKARNLVCLSSSSSQDIKKDLLIAFSNSHSKPLSLILAKQLSHKQGKLLLQNVHVFSFTQEGSSTKSLVESYASLQTSIDSLMPHYRKLHDTFSYEELSTKHCLIKAITSSSQDKNKGYFELSKRFFFLFIPMSFLVLGTSCATSLGRESKSSIKTLIFLTMMVLASYFLGKSFEKKPFLAACFFLASQACLFIFSIHHLSKIQKGVDA